MLGRFFALENLFTPGCGHSPEQAAAGLGCDKCYWKHMRKNRPAVVITLTAPDNGEQEQEPERKKSYPLANVYPPMPRIPGT